MKKILLISLVLVVMGCGCSVKVKTEYTDGYVSEWEISYIPPEWVKNLVKNEN